MLPEWPTTEYVDLPMSREARNAVVSAGFYTGGLVYRLAPSWVRMAAIVTEQVVVEQVVVRERLLRGSTMHDHTVISRFDSANI